MTEMSRPMAGDRRGTGSGLSSRDRTAGVPDERLVFVGGLHRSGTTPLARCLAQHPDVSGFSGTGVPEDEGQHLQDVYPTARRLGGPGRFARHRDAHMTEDASLASTASAERLWQLWRPYWDTDRSVLVEKSPPNLLRMRFLQRLFPRARFIMIMRHPVVVTLSTAKWTPRTPLPRVMDNWFAAHETFRADLAHVPNVHVLTYEELTRRPLETMTRVADFCGLSGPIPSSTLRSDRSSSYEDRWNAMVASRNPLDRAVHRYLVRTYSERALGFGYSLDDLAHEGKARW